MLNIVLFGPPGAGKGTQSEKLINKYNLVHLSTGDILRGEIAAGTDLGMEAKKLMDAGVLVPDEVVIGMISSKLDQNKDAKGFIFDGFPRTAAQAEALDKLLSDKSTSISAMLALEVDDEELTKRLLLRGRESGRADDQDETVIRNRVREYNNKTAPLKEYYSKQNKFKSVHGIGSIDEIFGSLSMIIDEKLERAAESIGTKVAHLVKAVTERVMPHSEKPEAALKKEKSAAAPKKESKAPAKKEEEKPSLVQRVVSAVKKAVTREKAPVKKAVKKASATVKKVVKKAAAKKGVKAIKKLTPKKTVKTVKKAAKKIVKKAAPKKAVKKAIKKAAAKKVAPKKVVKKAAKKIIKEVAPKKAIRTVKKAAKKVVKKTAAKKTAPKKALKKAVKKVVKKATKKIATAKKAVKTVKKAGKKIVKKPAKRTVKKASKKMVLRQSGQRAG